jgi:ectoine hydroxylase-related dioxygenase (phytanoyl-CoA dioxygenase family)
MKLDSETIDGFARNGAVVVRGALSAEEIARLTRGIDQNLAAPSSRAKVASDPNDPGQFIEDFCNWQDNADYRATLFDTALPALAAQLMGAEKVRLYHDHMLTKTAATRQKTPWHQDQPYYNIEGRQTVSFWIPVDPIPREATLEFIAGSHLGPWLMPRSFRDSQAKWFPEGSLSDLPDIEKDRAAYPILGWALQPGDLVAFNMLTLHAAGGSQSPRRVFSARYVGDDVTHAPRPWTTSPEFPDLAEVLPAGAPLDHPLFPVVFERS